MTKCFNTLHKDPDQQFSDRQKVEKLLKLICCSDPKLLAAKAIIDQNFPRNFIGASRHFLQQVAQIHGPAQLEYRQSRHRKRGISVVDTRPNRGGRGRGRFANHSGGRGSRRGDRGWGRGGRSYGNHVINGINVSDPNCSFTTQEWEALGPNGGRTTVMQMRECLSGRGGHESRGRGRGARGTGTNKRNVSAMNTQEYEGKDDANTSTITSSERGGRNGCVFGSGAYRQGGCSRLLGPLALLLLLLFLPITKYKRRKKKHINQPTCRISIISKQHVGRAQSRNIANIKNNTVAGHIARNELDTHADTCCAGANWSFMELIGEICNVNPFLDSYQPIQEIPVARCCMVWTNQDDSVEYLLVGDQMLWFGTQLPHSLINPNQLRAYGIDVNDGFFGNRNLKTPVISRTLHLSKPYNSRPTPHPAMQPRIVKFNPPPHCAV
jgi:hypothetical protein